jgi:uncharacterized protein YutE (UPF0331/DUF86 family)
LTNVVLVARKLATLDDHLQRLRQRRPQTVEIFERELLLQDAIAMSVLVIVQEAMDIALHISSDEGWPLASTYREAFAALEQHGIIDAGLAASMTGTAQLRNRIAHGYASVDAARLWAELPAGMRAFEAFAAAIATYLARAPANDGPA